jgi:hypothetical protein
MAGWASAEIKRRNVFGRLGRNGWLRQKRFWAAEKNFKFLNQGFGF